MIDLPKILSNRVTAVIQQVNGNVLPYLGYKEAILYLKCLNDILTIALEEVNPQDHRTYDALKIVEVRIEDLVSNYAKEVVF